MKHVFFAAICAMALNVPAFAQDKPVIVIEDVSVRLFYEESGELSADITKVEDFIGWNTIIGEGSAREPADNMLVTVKLKTDGEQFIGNQPLSLVAKSDDGVNFEGVEESYLTSDSGVVHIPFWIQNAGCAGNLEITARVGKAVKEIKIALHCGE